MLILALAAALITSPVSVNVDVDPERERLVPEIVEDVHGFEQRRVVLEDGCGRFRLLPPHDTIAVMTARELDDVTDTREILVEGRSGAAGRAGTTRVLRFAGCRIRTLFAYDSARPRHRAPRGWYVAAYGLRARRGTLRLDEYLARNSEPAIAASRRRISVWRYGDRRFTRRSVRFAKP